LADSRILKSAAKAAVRDGLHSAGEVLRALDGVDSFPPWSFSIESICSSLKVATVSESDVYRNLTAAGYEAMRTPFEKTGVKTDAEFAEVVKAVKRASGEGAGGHGVRTRPHGGRHSHSALIPSQK